MKLKILFTAMALSLGACSGGGSNSPMDDTSGVPAIDPNAGPGVDGTDPEAKPIETTDPADNGNTTTDPVDTTDPVTPVVTAPEGPVPSTTADLNDPATGFLNGPDADRETSRWQCRLASATNQNVFFITGFYGDASGYYANHNPRYLFNWAATGNDVNYTFAGSNANIEFADITFLTPTEFSVTINVTDAEPEERICALFDLEGNIIGEDSTDISFGGSSGNNATTNDVNGGETDAAVSDDNTAAEDVAI